jgi:hypothetical protein
MEVQRERRYSSYSLMSFSLDGVSGQLHALACFTPGEKPPAPTGREAFWSPERVRTQRLQKKCFCFCPRSNLDRPVVQSVVRNYTDRATLVHNLHDKTISNLVCFATAYISEQSALVCFSLARKIAMYNVSHVYRIIFVGGSRDYI